MPSTPTSVSGGRAARGRVRLHCTIAKNREGKNPVRSREIPALFKLPPSTPAAPSPLPLSCMLAAYHATGLGGEQLLGSNAPHPACPTCPPIPPPPLAYQSSSLASCFA
eukprot:361012-Chlamydomonas_euryale.AAC.4